MKSRQIGHTSSQYGQRFPLKLSVHGMGLLSLKLCYWKYLDQILFKISGHPFRIILKKGPAEYSNRKEISMKLVINHTYNLESIIFGEFNTSSFKNYINRNCIN